MDERIYFHQYRRPRVSNPTYTSSNVLNSMTFFRQNYQPQLPTVRESQRNNTIDTSQRYQPTRRQKGQTTYLPPAERRQSSRLSGLGQRSLQLDQKGVYHKQSSPYNILNLKPNEYSNDIKQYPWFSIENKDDVYYRRMNQLYSKQPRAKTLERPPSDLAPQIAGKHTYSNQPKISANPQKQPSNFTAKMLNHMDELQHNLA